MNSKDGMKKTLIYIVTIILLVMIPFSVALGFVLFFPDFYEESYARVIEVQFNYLKKTKDEDRIVILGTSSTSFGIDAKMLEERFKKPVVLLGLYGALGNTCVLEWAKKYIDSGDTVIYMYDIYDSAMHINFDPKLALQGTYKNLEMYSCLNASLKSQIIAALPMYVKENITMYQTLKGSNKYSGIYSIHSFDEKGHMIKKREGTQLGDAGFEVSFSSRIRKEMIDEEFTSYVKSWGEELKNKNINTFFCYGPVNILSRDVISTDENIVEFMKEWESQIGLYAINDMRETYINAKYFYDGNYHLNSEGAELFTQYFINKLEVALYGNSTQKIPYMK